MNVRNILDRLVILAVLALVLSGPSLIRAASNLAIAHSTGGTGVVVIADIKLGNLSAAFRP